MFVDTNILVYANLNKSPWHEKAAAALQNLHYSDTPIWINRQILREYIAVMTRADLLTASIPAESIVEDVRLFQFVFNVADETSQVTDVLLELLKKFQVRGKQIHDTNIVASMLACGVRRLLTNNAADFARSSSEIEILDLQNLSTQ